MRLFRGLSTAVQSLWDYKGRTTLAILGIVVSSLLLSFLLAVLYNFKTGIEGEVEGFGLKQIVAMPGRLLNSKVARMDLSTLMSVTTMNSTLTYQDALNVKRHVLHVIAAVPQTETVTSAHYGSTQTETLYTGTTPDFNKVFRLPMAEGRWLNNADLKNEAQSLVLGAQTKQELFGNRNAIGRTVTIKGVEFTVVGVLEPKQLIGFNFDERAYTVYPMVIDTTDLKHASMIFFSVDNQSDMSTAANQIQEIIFHDHGTKDYMLVKADEALVFINLLMKLVTAVTIGIASVSYLVGGLGIMNVMLLVVKERTREIGLRKAVGAKAYHVLLQFLVEAGLMSIIGGAAGIVIAYCVLRLLHHLYPALTTAMPTWILTDSLCFAVAIGLVFGLIPAIKAVRVQPIDALKYE